MRTLLGLCAVLGLVLVAGCQEHDTETQAEALRPVLSTVAKAELSSEDVFTGTVEPRYSTDLGFQVLGRLIQRNVNVGDIVKKGDVIGELDPAIYEFSKRSAEASLTAAEAQLDNAQASEKRSIALVKTGVTAESTLDSAVETRKSAEASVRSAKAELEKAEEQLSYTRLVATFDGVVTHTDVDVGEVVAIGETVITLARLDARDAVVDIPEDLVSKLRNRTFEVSLQAFKTKPVLAKVREVAPRANSTTRTQRFRMTLDDPSANYRFGALVRAWPANGGNKQINLPLTALLEKDGKTFVWEVDEQAAAVRQVEIKVNSRTQKTFTVAAGVEPGARIVTAGVHSLMDGQKIAQSSEH